MTTLKDSTWEVRSRPWRNPRTGIEDAELLHITCIHRSRGWVLKIERATPDRLASLNPEALWRSIA